MIDIGGRRFRLVRQGPARGRPTVLFEAGPFGASPDFAVAQAALGAELRSIAYDRAGLGASDPGPKPRDSRAVALDLKKLLAAAAEDGPFILVGHSMAAVHLYAFALRHPDLVAGLVLLDAFPPRALGEPRVEAMVRAYQRAVALAPLAAQLWLNALAGPVLGDRIDLPEPAKSEKLRYFASPVHNYWAAREVKEWLRDGAYVRALGDLDREIPVAVLAAKGGGEAWKALQAEPARRSRSGYAATLPAADHTSILGPRHAEDVVKAIMFVAKSWRARAPEARLTGRSAESRGE
jgi:pimeloyl-ACP methyl ester carboxylesterase